MAGKSKNIFLYLTLVCFIGIILIFVFDGYLGLYDTATITVGEVPQTIGVEQWQEQAKNNFIPPASVAYGQQANYSYEIANRRFSAYDAGIDVSLWHNQEKVDDLLTDNLHIKAFGTGKMAWTFDPSTYIPDGLPVNTSVEYTIVIKHGDIERKLLVYVYSTGAPNGNKIIPPMTLETR